MATSCDPPQARCGPSSAPNPAQHTWPWEVHWHAHMTMAQRGIERPWFEQGRFVLVVFDLDSLLTHAFSFCLAFPLPFLSLSLSGRVSVLKAPRSKSA